ncbi:MAG: hypothetical protein WBG86_05505 [Polyangiales bacterium]
MPFRPLDRAKFAIERWLVRGPFHRLSLAALSVMVISLAGGVLVLVLGRGFGELSDAAWWSFLRLTDPGYLGDDAGLVNRTLSVALTLLGYVVFLGALVAIMTQWLDARMEKLESGLTPVVRDGHILVLGWTTRTDAIIRELLLSQGRARRFLQRRGGHGVHIVLLANTVTAAFAQNLRDAVGPAWDERRVTIRSGSPLRPEHLVRVDAAHASAILIPGADFDQGFAQSDTQTIKTLMSLDAMATAGEPRPRVVAEIFEARKVHLARKAYHGDIEIVSSDGIVSRLLAQNIRHPGLSRAYDELLTHREGNEIYIREAEALVGLDVEKLHRHCPDAVLMGLVRQSPGGFTPILNAPPGTRMEEGDKLVLLARCYEESKPTDSPVRTRVPRASRDPQPYSASAEPRRVLILGWNHRVPSLLAEFGTYGDERYEVRIGAAVLVDQRKAMLRHVPQAADSLVVEHSVVDFTDPDDLATLALDRTDSVLFMGSDWMESTEESDARTLIGSLVADEFLQNRETKPTVILELLDPDNASLVTGARGELIISPLILSHLMTQIALRPELQSVFDELFTAGGAEITFRPISHYTDSTRFTFEDLERAAGAAGETALGVRTPDCDRELHLNPPKTTVWEGTADLELVTLVTMGGAQGGDEGRRIS